MKLLPLAAMLLVPGCWMSEGPSDPAEDPRFPDGDRTVVVPPLAAECARTEDGEFDFMVHGVGYEEYEGATIHASAVEPSDFERELLAMRSSSVVDGGTFALECARSIHHNMMYPSYALYLDVDHDGACTSADLGYEQQFYGWTRGIETEISASDWFAVASGGPFGRDFCTYYGF